MNREIQARISRAAQQIVKAWSDSDDATMTDILDGVLVAVLNIAESDGARRILELVRRDKAGL